MPHPNSRGERRALARKLDGRHPPPVDRGFEQKKWKLIFRRANKLRRAQKTGKIWPHREWEKLMADAKPCRILFICSRNQLRSPTGEAVFGEMSGIETRSAGTARDARHQVNMADIRWADLIVCMEAKHANRLKADFRQAVTHKAIHVLDIQDDYRFMQDELIQLLADKVTPLIQFGD